MQKNKKAFFTIFLIVFIDLLGFGIIIPLLPFIAENFGASPFQIGLLVAVYSVFQFISSPFLGRLSDRYGRKKLLILSQIGSSIGFILLALSGSLPLLFLSRIIDGITGGNISIAQAYIADITDKDSRAKGMGMLGAAFGLGFMFGPAIGGILSNISFSAPAIFSSFLALLAALLSSVALKETVNIKIATKSKKTAFSFDELKHALTLQPLGILIVAFFVISLGFSGIQGTFALWVERTLNWGASEIGYIFTFIGAISTVTQLFVVPKSVKYFGERNTLKISLFITTAGFMLFPTITKPWQLPIANFLIAFGNGLAGPTLQSIASESVDKKRYGGTLGLLQSAGSLGRIGGPIFAGYVFNLYGKNSPFIISGLILLSAALIVYKYLDYLTSPLYKLRKFFFWRK